MSDDDEEGESESSEGNVEEPEPSVQPNRRRGRPPKNPQAAQTRVSNRASSRRLQSENDDDSGLMSRNGYAGGLSRTERAGLRAKKRRVLMEDEESDSNLAEDQK